MTEELFGLPDEELHGNHVTFHAYRPAPGYMGVIWNADWSGQFICELRPWSDDLAVRRRDATSLEIGIHEANVVDDLLAAVTMIEHWVATHQGNQADELKRPRAKKPPCSHQFDHEPACAPLLRMHYECQDCGAKWTDEHSSACDSDCPTCNNEDIGPIDWEEIAPCSCERLGR